MPCSKCEMLTEALDNERASHLVTAGDLGRVREERGAMSNLLLDRSNQITSLTLRARTAEAELENTKKELALLRRFLKGSRYD